MKNRMICDAHTHIENVKPVEETLEFFKQLIQKYNYDKMIVHALPSWYGYSENYMALYLKAMLWDKGYASMGMCHHFNDEDTSEYYLTEIKKFHDMGFDGIKFLEGKPKYRKKLGRRLDDKVFDKLFEYAEENELTVTYHVGDPIECWGKEQEYYTKRDLTLDELREETFGILRKFPKLKLVYAHFNFMSEELARAEEIFETWENVCMDLTPGGEMFLGFTKNYDRAKKLVEKYSDRILFGTDASGIAPLDDWSKGPIMAVNEYISGKNDFTMDYISDRPLKPFNFNDEILDKIYGKNFIRLYGENPKPLDYELIVYHARNLDFKLSDMEVQNMNKIINFFEKKGSFI